MQSVFIHDERFLEVISVFVIEIAKRGGSHGSHLTYVYEVWLGLELDFAYHLKHNK